MAEERVRTNTKAVYEAFIEYQINSVFLASQKVIESIVKDSQDDSKRTEVLREQYKSLEAEALAFGIAPINIEKALRLSTKAKPILDELEALSNEMGRRYTKAMRVIEERLPQAIYQGLSLKWVEDTESPIGGRVVPGKAIGGVGKPHGFTANWQGKEFVYALPKHKAEARLSVFEDGRAVVDIVKDGKAASHEATSPSQAAMLLHTAIGRTYANGKPYAPKTDVWQEVKKAEAKGKVKAEAK